MQPFIISKPIKYNLWKHHFSYLYSQLELWINSQDFGNQYFMSILPTLGNSQMDMYVGKLSPQEVGEEICEKLPSSYVKEESVYLKWLAENNNYQNIQLSDGSVWTLLAGNETERHIHIHPARHSVHTLRVDANTLKTTVLALVASNIEQKSIDLAQVNQLRVQHLGLSPIKKILPKEGIGKWIQYFQEFTFS
ncbi:MAG: hypothetical protein ACKVTZ_23455 [Bacteroidia bacterium]